MELTVQSGTEIKIHSLSEDEQAVIRKLITTAQTIRAHLYAWERSLEEKLSNTEKLIDSQLEQIHKTVNHFHNTLQSTNAQEWHATAESIYKEGRDQFSSLQETYSHIKKSTKEICARFDRTTHQITKTLSNTLTTLHPTELEQLAEDGRTEIKTVTEAATQQITQVLGWFHWKNITLAFFLSLIVALFISLYIDDEWPWETHKTVLKERVAGQMLITAWPQLSHAVQQEIMDDFA